MWLLATVGTIDLSSCEGAMAADQEQFYQLLATLLSTDNTIRQQAEVSAKVPPKTPNCVDVISIRANAYFRR